jgi:L-amino acid N-acyltransferase YncA
VGPVGETSVTIRDAVAADAEAICRIYNQGIVTAWASLNRFNPRPVYDQVADLSVYVERAWRGRGVGRTLLGALVDRARTLGYHKMVLAAFPDNAAGLALYTRLGFTRVGVYREQGLLDGRWADVVVMERLL